MSKHRLIVLALLALAGCGEPGTVKLDPQTVYQRLESGDIHEMIVTRQCGILLSVHTEGVPGQSVTWKVFSGGKHMVDFTARLAAVGSRRTRITVEISKDRSGREDYDGSQDYPRPTFQQPLRPAVEEMIAALVAQRPYDVSHVPGGGSANSACLVQRGGLETGTRFSVDDYPSMDSEDSEARRREDNQ